MLILNYFYLFLLIFYQIPRFIGFKIINSLKNRDRRILFDKKQFISDDKPIIESNPLATGLSLLGFTETAYLTWSKLQNFEPICTSFSSTTSNCNNILTSPYGEIPFVNIPLSLLGMTAYSLILLLEQSNIPNSNIASFGIASAMGTFSIYLMIVLQLVLHESCNYCYLSAFLSISLTLVTWNSIRKKNTAAIVGLISASVTALFSIFMYYTTSTLINLQSVEASTAPAGQIIQLQERNQPPKVLTKSNSQSIKLANKLKLLDARMYGAYWCSHCNSQKQYFGSEAMKLVNYIECDKEGYNSQKSLCTDSKVILNA